MRERENMALILTLCTFRESVKSVLTSRAGLSLTSPPLVGLQGRRLLQSLPGVHQLTAVKEAAGERGEGALRFLLPCRAARRALALCGHVLQRGGRRRWRGRWRRRWRDG